MKLRHTRNTQVCCRCFMSLNHIQQHWHWYWHMWLHLLLYDKWIKFKSLGYFIRNIERLFPFVSTHFGFKSHTYQYRIILLSTFTPIHTFGLFCVYAGLCDGVLFGKWFLYAIRVVSAQILYCMMLPMAFIMALYIFEKKLKRKRRLQILFFTRRYPAHGFVYPTN